MILQISPCPSVSGIWNLEFRTWNEESQESLPEVEIA